MTTRTAGGGRSAVRRAHGALIALCAVLAALAVLVHHETTSMASAAPMGASSATGTHARATHARGAASTMHGPANPATSATWTLSTPHGVDVDCCAASGAQHCAAAGVTSVQLAVPGENGLAPLADPARAWAVRTPAGAVGRAPPDLTVLSRLRI